MALVQPPKKNLQPLWLPFFLRARRQNLGYNNKNHAIQIPSFSPIRLPDKREMSRITAPLPGLNLDPQIYPQATRAAKPSFDLSPVTQMDSPATRGPFTVNQDCSRPRPCGPFRLRAAVEKLLRSRGPNLRCSVSPSSISPVFRSLFLSLPCTSLSPSSPSSLFYYP